MSYEAWGEPEDRYYNEDEAAELEWAAFVRGAQACREMLARFVEQGGDAVTANSIRLNWNPAVWGNDPGKLEGEIPGAGDGA
jgi:hypothetical protein